MVIGSRQRIGTAGIEPGTFWLEGRDQLLTAITMPTRLGVNIIENLTWAKHVEIIIKEVVCNITILCKIQPSLTVDHQITAYKSIILPHFNYCSLVWDSITETVSDKLQKFQNRAVRLVSGLPYSVPSNEIRQHLGWPSLVEMHRRDKAIISHFYTASYLKCIYRI